MRKSSIWLGIWTVFMFVAVQLKPAYAYLDPGTGSIILQAVIGAVAGALIVGKLYWYKLVAFFRGRHHDGSRGGGRSKGEG